MSQSITTGERPTAAATTASAQPTRSTLVTDHSDASARVTPTLTLAAQAGLLAGPFLSMVDSNIVNVAIPDIARQLATPLAIAQWVVSGYLLALAATLAATRSWPNASAH